MKQKKLFVVLEQGNGTNCKLTETHKTQFTTSYSDCFRLNWEANKDDLLADYYQDNIVHSEGRSMLFEKVKGQYEYYIFIDDDVSFTSDTEKSEAEELKHFFETYKPITGTISGIGTCTDWTWASYNKSQKHEKEAYCIMAHDLCVQYMRHDFAELMYPTIYHGCEQSMWYAELIGYKLHPHKCLAYNKVKIKNTRHVPHKDHQKSQFIVAHKLVKLFSKLLKNPQDAEFFLNFFKNSGKTNQKMYELNPIKDVVKISLNDIGSLFNINSDDYKNRNWHSYLT